MKNKNYKYITINGNLMVAKSSYPYFELACIFPITPTSEVLWKIKSEAVLKKKNFFGFVPEVFQYNSELGSAAGVHGALQNGILAATATASQGLLLMLPNIYKCCGELLPCVIHVGTRSIAKQSLSIHGDHSDIYSVRQAGPILLSSISIDDIQVKAAIAHGIAIEASYPVIHFYDAEIGTTIKKVAKIDVEFYKKIINPKALEKFRLNALNPMRPVVRGGHENSDTFFQSQEAQNLHIQAIKPIIKKYLELANNEIQENYNFFSYYGIQNPKHIIVAMGSVCSTVQETIDDLNKNYNYECGLIIVHVYRPFYSEELVNSIPKTVTKIAVLSKTKEVGAPGEPLYVDVITAIARSKRQFEIITNGRYGLSSANTTPAHIKSIYDNLRTQNPKLDFTISIDDDVTFLSLPYDKNYSTKRLQETFGILLYGIGGGGIVSCSKLIGDIISNNTYKFIQIDKVHNSLKANNVIKSYIQVHDQPIKSMYLNNKFNFVVCDKDVYLPRFNMIENIKENGLFLLNTSLKEKDIKFLLPNKYKKILAERNCSFYIFDAINIANECKLKNKTSMIIASQVLYLLKNFINKTDDQIQNIIFNNIQKILHNKPKEIIERNYNAIKMLTSSKFGSKKIFVEPEWANVHLINKKKIFNENSYDEFILDIDNHDGDIYPVSSFQKQNNSCNCDGTIQTKKSSTFYSKKRINITTPRWLPQKCIQCNRCALVCPHATIRAFLLDPTEIKNSPQKMETLYAVGAEGYEFRIQVDAENCVGCGLCAEVCPVDALEMVPAKEEQGKYVELTNYMYKKIQPKSTFSIDKVKGAPLMYSSALLYPYFEGSGACAGCGETPYYRLLTQLFGKEMVIANATGCSSIYGGHVSSPFTVDSDGHGPAWANSLFEDCAEYGIGMRLAENYKINLIFFIINNEINNLEPKLKKLLLKWKEIYKHSKKREEQRQLRKELIPLIEESKNLEIRRLLNYKDSLVKKSMWIIGGDGWAFDIDFGGLRHALDSGLNLNIVVLNTESFSNTGGQISSASPPSNNRDNNVYSALRSEIGQMFLTHKNAYIAQTSMGMNPSQTIQAFKEAESYNGPSLVICYCPCISHGFDLVYSQLNEREAVLSGYFPIFRFDPRKFKTEENPLIIDFKRPKFELIAKFLKPQLRFNKLYKQNNDNEVNKMNLFINYLKRNFESLLALSEVNYEKTIDYKKTFSDVFLNS